jgi:hypothetical protein
MQTTIEWSLLRDRIRKTIQQQLPHLFPEKCAPNINKDAPDDTQSDESDHPQRKSTIEATHPRLYLGKLFVKSY